jgi:hypothetical protein
MTGFETITVTMPAPPQQPRGQQDGWIAPADHFLFQEAPREIAARVAAWLA